MQKINILFWNLLFLFYCYSGVYAQNIPKYSNEFLTIGAGARGLSMNGTLVGIANDVTAAYWNPAGLANIQKEYQFSLMHMAYFGGIANYDYAGFGMALDSTHKVAATLIRMGIDDIPDTRFLIDTETGAINYDNIGSFAEASYAFLLSYARQFQIRKLKISSGANFKVINRTAGIFSKAWGFGLDVGIQAEYKAWQMGIVAKDVTGTFNMYSFNTEAVEDVFSQTGNIIPTNSVEVTLPRLILGAGRTIRLNESFNVLGALSLECTFDGKRNTLIASDLTSISPALATEISYKKMAFLRAGIGNFQKITDIDGKKNLNAQPSFGIGFNIKKISIDYALTNATQTADLPVSHVFSLFIRFGNEDLKFLKK